MLHIADVTAAAVARSGCVRVGLLGTRTTTDLASSIYAGRLRAVGVEVNAPAGKLWNRRLLQSSRSVFSFQWVITRVQTCSA